MARIVFGAATSHTPMLALSSGQWKHRADADRRNPSLNLSDGRSMSYPQLLADVGPKYEELMSAELLREKAAGCQRALDRLAQDIEAARPDLVLIIGDDQAELFSPDNQPAFAVFHGAEVATYPGKYGLPSTPDWMRQVGYEYLMDKVHTFSGCPDLALELIEHLMERQVDVASISCVPKPTKRGFGHAYGFIVNRILRNRPIPVLPILLNTYYPPNVPSAARCYDIGVILAEAIAASPRDLRVAVIGSGGLSHFVVDEDLDRLVFKAIQEKDAQTLRSIPRPALQSGSSEILNWVMTAGAMENLPMKWCDYYPLYRTPAGTGTGAGFCAWQA